MYGPKHIAAALLVSGLLAATPARTADTMPPDIAAIMHRMGTGTRPTQEEQDKLQAWAAGMNTPGGTTPLLTTGGATGPGRATPDAPAPSTPAPNRIVLTASDRDGGEACPRKGRAAATPANVDKDAYIAMATDAVRAYGTQVPQDGRTAIDTALADRSKPVAGADLAVGLIARGYGSAAVIAAARGAFANPLDPNTANTLGTVLKGMEDYRRATIALAYAASLSPKSATLANNRAWLAFNQGDTDAASRLFEAATKLGPPHPAILLGQAMILECAGNHAKALPLFRASLKLQWSDMAAAGIQWAEGSLQKEQGPGADLGSPDAYGDKDGGKPGVAPPNWPDPPLPPTAREFAANLKLQHDSWPIYRFYKGWTDSIAVNMRTLASARTRRHETVIDDNGVTLNYGYDRELFMLDDIFAMIQARDTPRADKFIQQTENAFADDGGMSSPSSAENADPHENEACTDVRNRNTRVHIGYSVNAEGRWTDVRRTMADLYGFSREVLASIDDGGTASGAGALLAVRAEQMAEAYAELVHRWGEETTAAWRFKDVQCTPPPPQARPVGRLRPYKIDPNACHTGEIHLNLVILAFNADCAHMTLGFGELLQGSLDYKFGKDWDHDTLTIFAGAGFGTNGSATSGAVQFGAQAGVYATIGAGGTLLDAGISTQGSVSAGMPNAAALPGNHGDGPPPPDIGSGQGGAYGQLALNAQISLIDGPPNPITGVAAQTGEGTLTTTSGIVYGAANATESMSNGTAMHVPP